MNAADATVAGAVASVSSELAAAIDAIAERMRAGGRLVYVGAGSSGRIAALDASECEATFSTAPGAVVALVAGGETAPPLLQAAAEDDRDRGARRGSRASAQRGRLRRRRQRERRHAVRSRRARRRQACRRPHRVRRLCRTLRARRARRPRDRRDRRARVPRRIDAAQGRNGTEARTQHDLDRFDDPARKDLRKPHGRRRGREREAQRSRATDRRHRDRCVDRAGRDALAAADGDARVAIVSLVADVDARAARERLAESGGSIARALESAQ